MTIPIKERNRQILELRKEGVSRAEVARRFKLSSSRIYLVEKQDAADRSLAERRTKLLEEIRTADDLDKMWPSGDLIDALGLVVVTKKRMLDYFVRTGKNQMSLRDLMDMCLNSLVEGRDWMGPALLRVYGVGKKGFWSVVNGLTRMDLGSRCNEEWQKRLVKLKQESKITGPLPYSSSRE